MHPLRLMIVDASDLARNGIVQLIRQSDANITLLGAYATLEACEPYLQQTPVHILLLDDNLPTSKDIMDVVQLLHQRYQGTSIVILSQRLSGRYVQRLLSAGVSGFIYKEDHLEKTLVHGLQLVRNGHLYVSPRVAAFTYATREQIDFHLNETDREVLSLMAQGHNPQEIASVASLSIRSVYRIRRKLKQSLGVRTNEQIVDAARKKGLLDIPAR